MRGWTAVYRRELAGLFLSPLAWVLLCAATLANGVFFVLVLSSNGGEVNGAFVYLLGSGVLPFWILVVILPPLLTMRMISEESRSGMLEFLLTSPVSDVAVVVGKALAATTFLALVWLTTAAFGLVVQLLGASPDWGQIATGWLGATLLSGLFSALGLVFSALSGTPLLAAFLGILANLLVVIGPQYVGAVRWLDYPPLRGLAERVDVLKHFQGSFLTGALDSAHVVFFLVWTAAALFLAVRVVESRRWLG